MSLHVASYHRSNNVALANILRAAAIFSQRHGEVALRKLLMEKAGVKFSAHVAPKNRAAVLEAMNGFVGCEKLG
jgi:hypothetical protein